MTHGEVVDAVDHWKVCSISGLECEEGRVTWNAVVDISPLVPQATVRLMVDNNEVVVTDEDRI